MNEQYYQEQIKVTKFNLKCYRLYIGSNFENMTDEELDYVCTKISEANKDIKYYNKCLTELDKGENV